MDQEAPDAPGPSGGPDRATDAVSPRRVRGRATDGASPMSEDNGPVPPGDNPYRAPDQEPFARYRAPDQEPFAPYWAPQQPYRQPANPQYAAQPGPQLPYPGPAYPGPGQPYPPQPYGQPYGFAQPAPHNGMAIGALVVSIVAVLLAVIPFISVVGVGAAIVAVVLGFIGLRRTAAAGGRGMAKRRSSSSTSRCPSWTRPRSAPPAPRARQLLLRWWPTRHPRRSSPSTRRCSPPSQRRTPPA